MVLFEVFFPDPYVFTAARALELHAGTRNLVIRDTEELLAASTPDVHAECLPLLNADPDRTSPNQKGYGNDARFGYKQGAERRVQSEDPKILLYALCSMRHADTSPIRAS